ncbi:MAG TPA: YihY family inner membrane protein [Thermopetrobacter sp.]|nr:YihY family inner membrane protein [Thermopetrobacter sp.]
MNGDRPPRRRAIARGALFRRWLRRLLREYGRFLRGFLRALFDARLEHYAASLSWNTLFALIPLIVVMTAVVTTLPLFEQVRSGLERLAYATLLPDRAEQVRAHLDRFAANAGELGWLGTAWVILAVLLFFRTYDSIVNDTCGAPLRPPWKLLRDYGLMLLAVPLFAGAAYWLSMRLDAWLGSHGLLSWFHPLRVLPWLLVWAAFWMLYRFSPNRPVDRRAALSSSFIAALVWSLTRWLFVLYIARNQTYTTIYGGVAALLFFLLWLHLSWMIFIYGLKFCYLLHEEKGTSTP